MQVDIYCIFPPQSYSEFKKFLCVYPYIIKYFKNNSPVFLDEVGTRFQGQIQFNYSSGVQ